MQAPQGSSPAESDGVPDEVVAFDQATLTGDLMHGAGFEVPQLADVQPNGTGRADTRASAVSR